MALVLQRISPRSEGYIYVEQTEPSAPVVTLTCSCCGSSTKGRQWHNRDAGYGICPKCADWLALDRESPESMRLNYGVFGYHYMNSETDTLADAFSTHTNPVKESLPC